MKQRLHFIGEHKNLTGISCEPFERTSEIAIVLLNAGVVHKVGPFSLNRVLSDFLSENGFFTFRFDFAGLGDSPRVARDLDHSNSVLSDLTEVLDFLENKFNVNKVVIIGLCTGAENGYKIALQDTRVVGNVWLDGYGYDTLKGKLTRFRKRFVSLKRLAGYLSRLNQSTAVTASHDHLDADDYQWTLPPKNELSDNLDIMHDRGVKFLNIYSGGVIHYNSYKYQFRDTFDGSRFLASMDIEYFSLADHSYKIMGDREKLLNRILGWLKTHW